MNRRRFVSNLVGAAGCVAFDRGTPAQTQSPDGDVKQVLVMFKCHLDVGFVDTQQAIIKKYFEEYFPKAIQIANTLRQAGVERYVWTTGSWLLYEYLEQAGTEQRQRMEQAIARGRYRVARSSVHLADGAIESFCHRRCNRIFEIARPAFRSQDHGREDDRRSRVIPAGSSRRWLRTE